MAQALAAWINGRSAIRPQPNPAQLDQVLDIECEIKRLHIALAMRLKNHPTPELQEQLHKMRMDYHPEMPEMPEN